MKCILIFWAGENGLWSLCYLKSFNVFCFIFRDKAQHLDRLVNCVVISFMHKLCQKTEKFPYQIQKQLCEKRAYEKEKYIYSEWQLWYSGLLMP